MTILVTLKGECFDAEFEDTTRAYDRDGVVHCFVIKDRKTKAERSVLLFMSGTDKVFVKNYDSRIENVRLNRLRRCFDSGEFDFSSEMPNGRYKELPLRATDFDAREPASDEDICRLIWHKAYWIGFQVGGGRNHIDFGPELDLEYLGIGLSEVNRNVWHLAEQGWLQDIQAHHHARPTGKLVSAYKEANGNPAAILEGSKVIPMFGAEFAPVDNVESAPISQIRKITDFTRTEIVDALLLDKGHSFYGSLDLVSFLKRIWPLDTMPSEDSRFDNAAGDIWQHMVNNSDWEYTELLYRRLDITSVSDEQFARFLESCVHPLVARTPERIQQLIGRFNEHLKHDGFEMRPKDSISGRPIYKVLSVTGTTETLSTAYEVVLSFAGENRDYVEKVAATLKLNGVSLFYDDYEEASLWGKDLNEHLQKVYSGSARYCVMFISKYYAEKVWPTVERRSAFEKAIEAKEEYILPARFDDTDIPGLHKTVRYVDLRTKTPDQLAGLILKKLGRTGV